MFGLDKRQKEFDTLQEYLNLNNIIYSFELIDNEFKDLEDKYYDLNLKCSANVQGYEKYTDEYVFEKRVELLRNLFIDLPNLHQWSSSLKVLLNTRKKKDYYVQAGMTLGKDSKELSPTEILLNEEKCKERLNVLHTQIELDNLYGKKR